ncbi:MAG: DR2241 family protein [Limisphaerales bacterium]
MPAALNPAFAAWLAAHPAGEVTWIQVLVHRDGTGFGLRHIADREAESAALRLAAPGELRTLALHTAAGLFRPLRAAPDLRAGWRCAVPDAAALGRALDTLYPGTIADWHACRTAPSAVTSFEVFTARQTGMYRVTQALAPADASAVARATCAPSFCLKHRRWTAAGEADPEGARKSAAPCLEPCAVALEMARHAARRTKQPRHALDLAADELATLRAALAAAAEHPSADGRAADFSEPLNPRRVRLLRERFPELFDLPSPREG